MQWRKFLMRFVGNQVCSFGSSVISMLYSPGVVQQDDDDDSYDDDLTKTDPLNEVCFHCRKDLPFELDDVSVK